MNVVSTAIAPTFMKNHMHHAHACTMRNMHMYFFGCNKRLDEEFDPTTAWLSSHDVNRRDKHIHGTVMGGIACLGTASSL